MKSISILQCFAVLIGLLKWFQQTNIRYVDSLTEGCNSVPGDAIAIPTPAFPGYLALASLLRLNVVEIPVTPWIRLPQGVNAHALRKVAISQGIDFFPGDYFSLESRFQNYIRLVVMPPFPLPVQQQLERLAALM